jgi:hypothetical protein
MPIIGSADPWIKGTRARPAKGRPCRPAKEL